MADRWQGLLDDLAAEHRSLDRVVAHLASAAWDTPTPAEGWRVREQIGHLTFYDRAATLAATDPATFESRRDEAMADLARHTEHADSLGREHTGADLLALWREARSALLAALEQRDPSERLPWYGPPMSARSFATARLMETWAHGRDVADAVAVEHEATDRLRHIAFLGCATRVWSYAVRGLDPHHAPVRVELTLPSGTHWRHGDEHAADRVTGAALEFCLVVTQRRDVADTMLVVEGPAADEWMRIAQAFAGPPGPGRPSIH